MASCPLWLSRPLPCALLPTHPSTPSQVVTLACPSAIAPSFGNPSSASKVQGFIPFPLDQHFTKLSLPGFSRYSASPQPLRNELVRKTMQNADLGRIKYDSVCWFNHRAAQVWAVACLIPKFLSW